MFQDRSFEEMREEAMASSRRKRPRKQRLTVAVAMWGIPDGIRGTTIPVYPPGTATDVATR